MSPPASAPVAAGERGTTATGAAAADRSATPAGDLPLRPGTAALVVLGVLGAVLVLAQRSGAATAPIALVYAGPGMVASVLVAALGGLGAARLLTPRGLAPWWPLLALPLGLAVVGLTLTVLGILGLRGTPATLACAAVAVGLAVLALRRPDPPRADVAACLGLLACGGLAGAGVLLPVAMSGGVTVFGQNPDAHQVVGTALFLREAHPFAVDVGTALDRVPVVWRFRYPMMYVLGAVAEVAGQPPIRVFAALSALLVSVLAIGSGLVAQRLAGLPRVAALPIGAACGLAAPVAHAALHPYMNQLWGMALLPWVLLLGLVLVEDRDRRALVPLVLVLGLAFLSYPVAGPYPLVALAVLAFAALGPRGVAAALGRARTARRARRARPGRRRRWPWLLALGVVLALPLLGALAKLVEAVVILLDPSAELWEGDRPGLLLPLGFPLGLPAQGWWWPPVAILLGGVALAVGRGPRHALAWALVGAALLGLSVLLRARETGAYMDYKHLSFVGVLLLPLALAGLWTLAARGGRLLTGRPGGPMGARATGRGGRGRARWQAPVGALGVLAGVLGAVGWSAAAAVAHQREMGRSGEQVTSFTQELAGFSRRLPVGRTVLLDVPASATQLWATLAFADRQPLAATDPVRFTTYAVAPQGAYADYVVALRRQEGTDRPAPPPRLAVGRPVLANRQWGVWRTRIPGALRAELPDTASWRLRQPLEQPDRPPPGGDPYAGLTGRPAPARRP